MHTIRTLEDCQIAATNRGGKCLSTQYYGSDVKLEWECAHGHYWKAVASSILKGSWCPFCAHEKRRLSLEYLQYLAQLYGGKCFAVRYEGSSKKIEWECDNGHRWFASPEAVISGKWCKICEVQKNKVTILETLQLIAESHEGKCLSKYYINSSVKMNWQCKKGYQWKSNATNIKQGHWCPICALQKRKNR